MIKLLIGVMMCGVYISIGARQKVGGGPELFHADQKSVCIAECSHAALLRTVLLRTALLHAAIFRTAILGKRTFDRREP